MSNKSKFVVLFFVVYFALLVVNCPLIIASVPRLISYQGHLADESGHPIVGTHTLTFKLYTEPTGGTEFWTESHEVEIDSLGLYNVMLGSVTPFGDAGVDFEVPYYLGLSVDGGAEIGRYEVGSSPYAIHAYYADSVAVDGYIATINGVPPDGTMNLELVEGEGITITEIPDSNKIRFSGGDYVHPNRITLGSTTENGALFIRNRAGDMVFTAESSPDSTQGVNIYTTRTNSQALGVSAYGDGLYMGIAATTLSREDEAVGIIGSAMDMSAKNYGVRGMSLGFGEGSAGVYGNTMSLGINYGVLGEVSTCVGSAAGVKGVSLAEGDAAFSKGVIGEAHGGGDYAAGVYGTTTGAGKNYGVWGSIGVDSEDSSAGVLGDDGIHPDVVTFGVYGISRSFANEAAGVFGKATYETSRNYGVKGLTLSGADSAAGVLGKVTSGNTYGVYGLSSSEGEGTVGVLGKATGDNLNSGVMGISNGTAQFSAGVTGNAKASDGSSAKGVIGLSYGDEAGASGVYGCSFGSGKNYGVQGITRSPGDSTAGVFGSDYITGSSYYSFGIHGMTYSAIPGVCGVLGRAISTEGSELYGVKGETFSMGDGAAGVYGLSRNSAGKTYGVYGQTKSDTDGTAGVFGVTDFLTCKSYGVHGLSRATGFGTYSAGVYGEVEDSTARMSVGVLGKCKGDYNYGMRCIGNFRVDDNTNPAFAVDYQNKSVSVFNTSHEEITIFGGPTSRVAIQKVNNTATPTIPDNNFGITADAPIVVTNLEHGINISCPECCTHPCAGGGGCYCESTFTTGGGGRNGELKILTESGETGASIYYSAVDNKHNIEAGGEGTQGKLILWDAEGHPLYVLCDVGHLFPDIFAYKNLFVDGSLFVAGLKGFLSPHPEDESKNIRFSCTESPEVLIEYRSVLELQNGYGEIELPHEFVLMSEPGTFSVMCTPQTLELPEEVGGIITENGLVKIKARGGEDNMKVAYIVYATRKGYKDTPVVVTAKVFNMERLKLPTDDN
ncbi:hypothetical protein JXI42_02940 [bacterium]|nr:hypothetical protein [bacterium]